MDANSYIVLTLLNPKDGGPWVLHVRHKKHVQDPREAVAAAAREFLETDDGKSAADDNGGDFNYGDAANYIDAATLLRHGILELNLLTEAWADDHDRNFADAN